MAVKSVENSRFRMILYERENEKDFLQFKSECESIIGAKMMGKELVLDFTGSGFTLPAELSLIGGVLKKMLASGKELRLIVTPHLSKKLAILKVDKVPGVTLYASRSAFLETCIGSRSAAPQPGLA